MWSIEQLTTFKLVAEKENFSKAARILHISTAAVGKQIKNLENEIGAQLFYRTTRHLALTEIGKLFFDHCCSILNEIEKTKNFLSIQKNEVKGKIKIVSSMIFGEKHIVPYLQEMLIKFPDLIIDLELADRIPDVEKEDIDLLIGLIAGLPTHYTRRRIKNINYVFCASPGYLEQFGEPMEPKDLISHHFIIHNQRPHPYTIAFPNETIYLQQAKILTNSTPAMLQCCLSGAGISLFHLDNIKTFLEEKRLIEVLKSYRQPPQPLYLYFKTMRYIQPKLRYIIDFLIEKLPSKDEFDGYL